MRLPFWRRHQQAELEEEIRSHLDMAVRERVERGENPQEAARSAWRQFGNPLLVEEIARDMWGWTSLERLWQDVRYGLRLLVKEPGFTAVVVLTLAIGIGANTAVFSLVNTLILRPFFPDIQRLIVVQDVPGPMRGLNMTYKMSYAKYQAWRQHGEIFESLGAMYGQGPSLTGMGEPERLQAAFVSSEFLPALGISPVLGRGFRPEDEPRSAPPVVLLSYQFWRTRFASQKDVLGHTLQLNDELFTIVGVLPEHASLGSSFFRSSSALSFDVVAPLRATEMGAGANYLVVIGKIRPGLSVAAATAAIDSQTPAVNQQFGSDYKTQVIPLETYLMGDTRPLLLVVLGAVGVVLLITCANTANLLLARGAARQKEIAVRLALGARSLRIFRQLLTESLIMSLLGGALALLFLRVAREGLLNLLAGRLPNGIAIPIDSNILLSTLALSVVTGLSFGVAPCLQARNRNLRDALGQGGRTSRSAGSQRVRNVLVVAEIACSLALLAGAGLLMRSFFRLLSVDKGYSSEHVLTLRFWPGLSYTPETEISYLWAILQGTLELPGVENVGFSTNLPLGGNMTTGSFGIEGRPSDPDNPILGSKMLVGGDYFRALRIPLIAGRLFTPQDEQPKAPPVTIVDQAFAQRYFKNESPLGKRVNFGWGGGGWAEIIGVVGAVREMSLAAEEQPTVYAPIAQHGSAAVHSNIFMAVRSGGDPTMEAQAAKDVIHRFNGGQIVEHVRTMDDLINESVAANRAPMWLFGGFAAITVLLAAIGVYGVLSYYVVQRGQEIGIRMALGAKRRDVLQMVLGRASRLVAAGLVAGLLISLAGTRALTSLLFGTKPTDVPTFIAVASLLAFIGLMASIVPAIRATGVDPQVVLRGE